MGSGSESDSSNGSQFGKDVSHRMNATRMPFCTGILVELCFCILMTQWMNESKEPKSPLFALAEGTITHVMWLVFLVSVLGRGLCLFYSRRAILHRRSGRVVTILYMFFGTMQWLFYLSGYYIAYDAASPVHRSHKVNLQLEDLDVFFPNHTSFADCLMEHSWNYDACDFGVKGNCSMPYDPYHHYRRGECVSTISAAGLPCCISETIQIETPVMTVGGVPFNVGILFMLTKWLAVLLVGWVLRHGYFAAQLGTPDFAKDSWLDILDAVIFSANLELPYVRNVAYGFSPDGGPQQQDTWRVHAVYCTFVMAFTSAIGSCILYSALVPRVLPPSHGDMEADLEVKGEGQPVMVYQELSDEDNQGILCAEQSVLRRGYAVLADSGDYAVRFTDGLDPDIGVFPLQQLHPDFSKDDTPVPCCSGWWHLKELYKGGAPEQFERRAQVWRLHFISFRLDLVSWGGTTMLIGKNIIWGLMDLVKILSCGRPDAAVCRIQPMAYLEKATSSKLGQVWVGPSGIVAFLVEIVGSLHQKRLQHKESKLQEHMDWLLSESQKSKDNEMYSLRLQEMQMELVVIEEKKQFTFP